ncbi:hypothetical protein [Aquimarina litoralis]|uniref:hypothetical protein n=1 Tax=Aquimarina litoralis TaxID=584605 RepID=UPI001C57E68B|nr:hypothetical protein [Aquimarina litoralis]MBW1297140.1 hypothetical protein [Aquimarina litoralis]
MVVKNIFESKVIDRIVVFTLFFILFWFIIKYLPADMKLHIDAIVRVNNGQESYSPHFLFFFIVNFLSFFSNNISLMIFVTAVVLALASLGKYLITDRMISDVGLGIQEKYKATVIKMISFALLFCFAIPDVYSFFVLKMMYLGRTPSMVWHNSTIITVFPFAILLFWKQLRIFDNNYEKLFHKDIMIVSLLVIINILIKPSFVFVYIPVTALFILKHFDIRNYKDFLIKIFPIVLGAIVILIQFISIYYNTSESLKVDNNSIAIGTPFEFIRNFIPSWYIPFAFIFSFAFPIIVASLYKEILKYLPFVYSVYLAIFGILVSAFFIEDGSRKFHGNFTWQNIVCAYMVFLSTVLFLVSKHSEKRDFSRKMFIVWGVLLLHFLSGVLYLFKMYFTGSYI